MEETIQQLFFYCQMAGIMWKIVHVSFNITPPVSIVHMFTGWLNGINKNLMYKMLVGASSLCWEIWLSRNDLVFNITWAITPMQVIFRGTHWILFGCCCRRRMNDLILFGGVVCWDHIDGDLCLQYGWSFSNKTIFIWLSVCSRDCLF
jgi:hypothetical protein